MNKFSNILIILFVIILSVFIGFSIINFIVPSESEDDKLLIKMNNINTEINKDTCKCKLSDNKCKKIHSRKETKKSEYKKIHSRKKLIKTRNDKDIKVYIKENFLNSANQRSTKINTLIKSNFLTAEKYYQKKYNYPFLPFDEIKCYHNKYKKLI